MSNKIIKSMLALPTGLRRHLRIFTDKLLPTDQYCLFGQKIQPFSQDYDLVSHIIYGMCVNFVYKW